MSRNYTPRPRGFTVPGLLALLLLALLGLTWAEVLDPILPARIVQEAERLILP